jgi:putative acetyltransferase
VNTLPFDIKPARTPADINVAREMFREYQQWLGVDLCFQDFDTELAELTGKYAPPGGEIYIARSGAQVAGIVAVRGLAKISAETSGMKRLYVREDWRGKNLGRQLAELAVDFARNAGYRKMVLDTLPHLMTAKAMYVRMGFTEMAPYYENPLPGVVYMEKIL